MTVEKARKLIDDIEGVRKYLEELYTEKLKEIPDREVGSPHPELHYIIDASNYLFNYICLIERAINKSEVDL